MKVIKSLSQFFAPYNQKRGPSDHHPPQTFEKL